MSRVTVNSVRDLKEMLQNPWYQIYYEKKQELLQRYPPIKQRTREEQFSYMKEICDMMWEPDGPFQQFLWDIMSEQEKLEQSRRASGRKRYERIRDEEY
jgi:hypothetical protein